MPNAARIPSPPPIGAEPLGDWLPVLPCPVVGGCGGSWARTVLVSRLIANRKAKERRRYIDRFIFVWVLDLTLVLNYFTTTFWMKLP